METKTYPAELIAEETARIVNGRLNWEGYKAANRSGSKFLLSRADRKAIFDGFLATLPIKTATERATALQYLDTKNLTSGYLANWIA
jgi:hypothetical protein